eukprot:TRINITY_DN22327_c0_g1_i1.p1 TRINITY_DN22327_c0_g1~~TRINITY_DN22327_c0_g1_i1.p1  ORF type:complete len:454 (-),score=123.24 TRINITY_DN22327_c0_g1_i1:903-2264(-)
MPKLPFMSKRGTGSGMGTEGKPAQTILVDLLVWTISAAVSTAVLVIGLKQLDPNRAQAKQAGERKKEIAKRLGRSSINTNPYEDVIACDVINPDNISVTFESIGGLEEVKDALYELVILPLKRPELFTRGKLLRPQKGVLLYGPPGTGKTMMAKAIAKESGASFINVKTSNLMSKWFGDAQKLVTAVFTLAYKIQPAIIFIDEVDSFLGQRKGTEHEAVTNMKTEFMSLWDGFTTDETANVMVLCATNRPWDIDEAILRRLPRSFEIPLPSKQQRASILKVILRGEDIEKNIDHERIAALCDGYSGSDMQELCKQAAYLPIRDLLEEEKSEGREREYGVKKNETKKPRALRQTDLEIVATNSRLSKELAMDFGRRRTASELHNWGEQARHPETPQSHGEQSQGSGNGMLHVSQDSLQMLIAVISAFTRAQDGRGGTDDIVRSPTSPSLPPAES